jgi:pimeloyl-ACP methyl ester carboxylesterase
VALAAVAALLAAGCVPPARHPQATAHRGTHPTTTTTASTTTTTLPVAPMVWTACGGALQCGTLTVPLNYADPGGTTIGIAVERHQSEVPADDIGSLIINPGGPGVSGIDDFSNELSVLTPQLLDDFDVVTFDPRGVQRSDPVTCGESPGTAGQTGPLPNPVPQDAAAQQSLVSSMRQYGADCEKASGTVLPYVGTVDTAQDLERLRIALGDSGLNYMGQSYGTLLGLEYAKLFPTHIRAMVLDSVIDPALTLTELTLGQAKGFEQNLQSFFAWCATSTSCPWRGGSDPTATLSAQVAQSTAHAVPAGTGRTAGPGELYDALLEGLYSTSDWPELGRALAEDSAGSGAAIWSMSNRYNTSGSTNSDDAGEAIDCLDHPAPQGLATYTKLQFEFASVAPIFGPLLAWGEAGCSVWPVAPTRTPGPVHAPGSSPILVVGTTNDPATPYAWAQQVARELVHGDLLTRDGSDHVAYFYSSCVRGYVQSYFVSSVAPPPGTVCSS